MWYWRPPCSYTRLTPTIMRSPPVAVRGPSYGTHARIGGDAAQPALEEPVADAIAPALRGQVAHHAHPVEAPLHRLPRSPAGPGPLLPASPAAARPLLQQ